MNIFWTSLLSKLTGKSGFSNLTRTKQRYDGVVFEPMLNGFD